MSDRGTEVASSLARRKPASSGLATRHFGLALMISVLLVNIAPTTVDAASAATSVPGHGATPIAQSDCMVGTGTPAPPATTPDGPGCQAPAAATPADVPPPLAAESGAHPMRQALSSSEPGASLASGNLTPLTPSAPENLYWYSLFSSHQNCWQAGEPKESSYACDTVGTSYLPGHLAEGALDGDLALNRSGDYCNSYTIGQGLDTTDANKESEYTGYEPPSPLASYQEANHYRTVCQAGETFWGHEVRGANGGECTGITAPCGMQHYVSLSEQGTNDHPWSSSLGGPILIISAEANPYSYKIGTHFGAWGYVCPLFEEEAPTAKILEFCMEEWKAGKGFPKEESFDITSACASADGHFADQTITQFAPGATFATEKAGSTNTFTFTGANGGWKHFIAGITPANLESAITSVNSTCRSGYSTSPANYALIGIEHGTEGGGFTELGSSEGNLQLWTEYTPLPPPSVTTMAATEITPVQATLSGTVNPNGLETSYYFQYGETTEYGASTFPEGHAGSGTTSAPESATATGLRPGTMYHYRIVASNRDGTSYGLDRTFTTVVEPNVFFADASHGNTITDRWDSPTSGWLQTRLEGHELAKGTSSSALMVNGEANVFFVDATKGNTVTDRWDSRTSSWLQTSFEGDEVTKATSPSALMVGEEPNVFFDDASKGNTLTDRWHSPSLGWSQTNFGGDAVASGTSPSALMVNGEANVFFDDASKSSTITDTWDSVALGGWSQTNFGGDAVASGTSPSALGV
jgi:hypothetical protein